MVVPPVAALVVVVAGAGDLKSLSLLISSFLHCLIILFIFFTCLKKTKQKKGHFAEEFFAFSKNRSKTPRRFAPESRSFCSPILTKRSFPATPKLNFIVRSR